MADVIIEETQGTSKRSLTQALANAVKEALKVVDPNHKVNITVVIDSYELKDGEHQIAVKVLIMDITLEEEKAYQESKQELEERMSANQDLNEQMVAAIYGRPVFDDTDTVNALEHRMDAMGNRSSAFDFDAGQDNITLVASQGFHDQMRSEYQAAQPDRSFNYGAPSFDFGPGGGSSSGTKDQDAA